MYNTERGGVNSVKAITTVNSRPIFLRRPVTFYGFSS